MFVYKSALVFFSLVTISVSFNEDYNKDLKKCGSVHLTVSSLEGSYIELNWITKCDQASDVKPDSIELYDKNPLDRNEKMIPRVVIQASKYPDGYFRTKVKFGEPWLPGNWEYDQNLIKPDSGQHCFPYWVAAYKSGLVLDVKCLKISPTWMADNRHILGPRRLGSLFIPGTHNSATYEDLLVFENYVVNQDRTVWTQLVSGIRYLDLRIGYYGKEGFYINHDVVRVKKLVPVLKEIRKFVELAPKEVIIMDFHRFPYPTNFTNQLHHQLLEVVKGELGDFVMPSVGFQYGDGPTLNDLWFRNKSIIVSYSNRETIKDYDWLWGPITQYWGNTNNIATLKTYLDTRIKEHKSLGKPFWAIMAELTPQTLDVIFRRNSLRKLADTVNRQLTRWFRDELVSRVNIVTSDFFLGNDLINVAIAKNLYP